MYKRQSLSCSHLITSEDLSTEPSKSGGGSGINNSKGDLNEASAWARQDSTESWKLGEIVQVIIDGFFPTVESHGKDVVMKAGAVVEESHGKDVVMKAGAVVEESHGKDVVMKAGAVGLAIQSEVGAKEMMELVLNDEKEHVLVYKDFQEIIIPRTNIIMDDSIEASLVICVQAGNGNGNIYIC